MSLEKFAAETVVPIERSQAEVRAILNAHGCTKYAAIDDGPRSLIRAVLTREGGSIALQFVVTAPDPKDAIIQKIRVGSRGSRYRPSVQIPGAVLQETRRRWRCLVILLKSKFASVDSGIATFQEEFLANIMLPGGGTVGDWASREIGPAIAEGRMPTSLLLGAGDAR